jgi:hypothetical protein
LVGQVVASEEIGIDLVEILKFHEEFTILLAYLIGNGFGTLHLAGLFDLTLVVLLEII